MDQRRLTIIIVWRGRPNDLPALKSVAQVLSEAGFTIVWICGTASSREVTELSGSGTRIVSLGVESTGYEMPHRKAFGALVFRSRAWRAIEKVGDDAALWIVNIETAIVLGRRLLKYGFLLHVFELPESPAKRWLGSEYLRHARRVAVPEGTRAEIVRSWFKLSRRPDVIPNVQIGYCYGLRQFIGDSEIRETITRVAATRHIALYQGMICRDRDLSGIGRAVSKRPDRWALVLMGKDFGHLEDVRRANASAIHIPYIEPPGHMAVTSWATVGLLTYNTASLNNAHCAPNKVYEYGGFGLPMLANEAPGLRRAVEEAGAGVCCDTSDPNAVMTTLELLLAQRSRFATNSQALYARAAADGTAVECANALVG